MTWKSFWDNPQEIFIGACLQFPLVFIIGWWVIPVMIISSLLWRLGGVAGGNKLFRRIGVPLVACGSSFLLGIGWKIFLAIPFMIWFAPSYGENSWLFKLIKKVTNHQRKADYLTRTILYAWYWLAYGIALILA